MCAAARPGSSFERAAVGGGGAVVAALASRGAGLPGTSRRRCRPPGVGGVGARRQRRGRGAAPAGGARAQLAQAEVEHALARQREGGAVLDQHQLLAVEGHPQVLERAIDVGQAGAHPLQRLADVGGREAAVDQLLGRLDRGQVLEAVDLLAPLAARRARRSRSATSSAAGSR